MTSSDDAVPSGRIRRTMPLAGFTARAAGGRLVAGLRKKAGQTGAVDQFHERTAERYADLLGHSKGALMKVGQMMSMVDSRAVGTGGFYPYQKAMSRLQASAPPMHPDLVHGLLASELGSATEQFADFSDEPMAAASIGQVHRAVLRDGRAVAVKIQYPGVGQAIRDDLANTELLATFLRFMQAASGMRTDVRAVAREAAARISEEVDYRHEAATITTFGDLYRDHPFIRVPDVIPETSSDRVLTMTYLDGMDWAAAQHADQDLKNTWAEVIIRFNQGSFRHANLMHADPHPGNYRFNTDGTVGFVDFGCVKVLPEPERWRLVAMTRAVIEGRRDDYRHLMVQAGFLAADCDLTADELYQWQSETLYEIVLSPQPATYSPETTRRVLQGFFDVRDADHPIGRMNAPDDYVFASRATFALNAVAAGFRATLPMRAIMDDLDCVAEPVTELGKLHHAWVRERGLPSALDHHDHP
ncbi:AarF/ABC1/UbiB kinase family protein [Mycolicibacterium sp. S2-37]|uniref:ABC1 kinase family protein n=1 Tax=Mycolicibacterium sp. S2-37 TaxID=2810297 RepID=UPI001A9447AC|nr:AarF/ABC1/UbiB kinase family protein [Mycolicibacterium sp. S2-37]MBO0680023.1 AarF/ABC1/UbiB kinase family protein [Mycolicibacterium sp. S2-37]